MRVCMSFYSCMYSNSHTHTHTQQILNLAVDYRLNELWAYELFEEYNQELTLLLEDHPTADPHHLLASLQEGTPKCILHTAHKGPIKTFTPLLDYTIPSRDLPAEAVWNVAALYQDALSHGIRHPTLIRRLLAFGDPKMPKDLPALLAGLSGGCMCDV